MPLGPEVAITVHLLVERYRQRTGRQTIVSNIAEVKASLRVPGARACNYLAEQRCLGELLARQAESWSTGGKYYHYGLNVIVAM